MINVPRALAPFLFSAVAVALFGCSGADQPDPAGDSATELLAAEAAGTAPGALDPTHTTRAPLLTSPCLPREARECRVYYQDARGQWHCPWSYQLCQPDGKGWAPCGELVNYP